MKTKSVTEMMRSGELKRADALKALLEDIHHEPGFNWREEGADLEQSIDDLAAFIAAGGRIPDLEVRPRADGGVWLVDGHRRHRALAKLAAEGHPLPGFKDKAGKIWVPVASFTGSDAERMARVMTSQEGRKLTPVEIAKGYKRMIDQLGLGPEQVAKLVQKTRQHVDQMLHLANAGAQVHQLVTTGQVSATTAVQVVRKEGAEKAAEVLTKAADTAAAAGKKKATGAAVKAWEPGKVLVTDMVSTLSNLDEEIDTELRVTLESLRKSGDLGGNVVINAGLLLELLEVAGRVVESRKQHQDAQHDAERAETQVAWPFVEHGKKAA